MCGLPFIKPCFEPSVHSLFQLVLSSLFQVFFYIQLPVFLLQPPVGVGYTNSIQLVADKLVWSSMRVGEIDSNGHILK